MVWQAHSCRQECFYGTTTSHHSASCMLRCDGVGPSQGLLHCREVVVHSGRTVTRNMGPSTIPTAPRYILVDTVLQDYAAGTLGLSPRLVGYWQDRREAVDCYKFLVTIHISEHPVQGQL